MAAYLGSRIRPRLMAVHRLGVGLTSARSGINFITAYRETTEAENHGLVNLPPIGVGQLVTLKGRVKVVRWNVTNLTPVFTGDSGNQGDMMLPLSTIKGFVGPAVLGVRVSGIVSQTAVTAFQDDKVNLKMVKWCFGGQSGVQRGGQAEAEFISSVGMAVRPEPFKIHTAVTTSSGRIRVIGWTLD
jgi:hypothetical protein